MFRAANQAAAVLKRQANMEWRGVHEEGRATALSTSMVVSHSGAHEGPSGGAAKEASMIPASRSSSPALSLISFRLDRSKFASSWPCISRRGVQPPAPPRQSMNNASGSFLSGATKQGFRRQARQLIARSRPTSVVSIWCRLVAREDRLSHRRWTSCSWCPQLQRL